MTKEEANGRFGRVDTGCLLSSQLRASSSGGDSGVGAYLEEQCQPTGVKATCIRSAVIVRLFHITDWLPTLRTAVGKRDAVSSFAGDGIDLWDVISQNKPSKRREILYNINPLHSEHRPINAAIRYFSIKSQFICLLKKPERPFFILYNSLTNNFRYDELKLIRGTPCSRNCRNCMRAERNEKKSLDRYCSQLRKATLEESHENERKIQLYNLTADPGLCKHIKYTFTKLKLLETDRPKRTTTV